MQVGQLNAIIDKCRQTSPSSKPELQCGPGLSNGAKTVVQETGCDEIKDEINYILKKYSRATLDPTVSCTFGGAMKAAASCAAIANVLNTAVDSFYDGTFAACHLSTPTTSPTTSHTTSPTTTPTTTRTSTRTSTPTTSVTTSPTTTARHGKTACHQYKDSLYLTVNDAAGCAEQAATLNAVLKACTGKTGTLACTEFDSTLLLVDSTDCSGDAVQTGLEKLVVAYSRETAKSNVQCTHALCCTLWCRVVQHVWR